MKNLATLIAPILAVTGCFTPNLPEEDDSSSSSSTDSDGSSSAASDTGTTTPSGATTTGGDETTIGDDAGSTTTGDPDTTGGDEPPAVCGDGIVAGDEDCDEGDLNGVDGMTDCLDDCTLTTCGDGFLGLPDTEECDQEDDNADDGACTTSCTAAFCGDDLVGPGESCDDGPKGSDLCTPDCALTSCGDGLVQSGEECDDENEVTTDACVNCVDASCGDGFLQAGVEQCDEGAGNASEPVVCAYGTAEEDCTYCDATSCAIEQGDTSYCGDGVLQAGNGEECDDGVANGPNGACLADCSLNTCGDGNVGPGEACDDGEDNALAAGACAPNCSTIIETREITISGLIGNGDGDFGPNPVAAADAACPSGYQALLTDPGDRQVTNTPNEADFIIDWPLAPYTRYVNSLGDQVWITDDAPLLGVRDGSPEPVENVLSNGGGIFGYFLVTGMEQDWTPLSGGLTCQNYTSDSSSLSMRMGAAALTSEFIRAEGAVYGCEETLLRVYCIEQ